MSAHAAALNALEAAATGQRVCENAACAKSFKAARRWARFCCTACRKAHFDETLRRKHIRDYLSELGRKGAAARKAKRKAA
jgi:ribulose kinase